MRKGTDFVKNTSIGVQETFSERLRLVMQYDKMETKQLAKAIDGCSVNVSHYRSGKYLPNLERAVAIAKALNVSLDWLCGLED